MAHRTAEEYSARALRYRTLADAGVAKEYDAALREMAAKYDRFARALVAVREIEAELARDSSRGADVTVLQA
jgi:hypothetical protein